MDSQVKSPATTTSKVTRYEPPLPAPVTSPNPSEEGEVMGFFEHINELRVRLTRALIALLLGMLVSVLFTNPTIELLKQKYGQALLILNPTDSIVIFFRVALMLGAIVASPMITYQLFRFILPGLTRNEKKWLLLSLPGTTALFMVGLAFTWVFLLPAYVNFLRDFQSDVFKTQWTADSYIGFVTAVLIWHAAAFETPLIFYVLARFGFVTARGMVNYWRQAIVGASIIAAIITPTVDPVTMSVIMGILLVLYIISIILVAIAARLNPANKPLPS